MFGETEIVDERISIIDSKHRIIIPKFTKVEVNEKLIPQFNAFTNILLIFSKDEFYKRTERFEEYLREQILSKKITPQEKRQLQRVYYGHLSFMPEEVDGQRRMFVPERAVSKLELTDKIFIIGKETHIEICKDKETYDRILAERESRIRR